MSAPTKKDQIHMLRVLTRWFEASNSDIGSQSPFEENACFCRNYDYYDWKYIENREILAPRTYDDAPLDSIDPFAPSNFPCSTPILWERRPVWIVGGILKPGESNVLHRRRLYLHEHSWLIMLREGYDNRGSTVQMYIPCGDAASAETVLGRWYLI